MEPENISKFGEFTFSSRNKYSLNLWGFKYGDAGLPKYKKYKKSSQNNDFFSITAIVLLVFEKQTVVLVVSVRASFIFTLVELCLA